MVDNPIAWPIPNQVSTTSPPPAPAPAEVVAPFVTSVKRTRYITNNTELTGHILGSAVRDWDTAATRKITT